MSLSSPSDASDKRRTLWRADIPAVGRPFRVNVGAADLRSAPDLATSLSSQLLFGEVFVVYDDHTAPGWVWGQSRTDAYVGWTRREALSPLSSEQDSAATHWVCALSGFVFPAPDMKRPPRDVLGLTARARVVAEENGYCRLDGCGDGDFNGEGWVYKKHLSPLGRHDETDYVVFAERLLGAPYLWGGKSARGIDCSGLVQIALAAIGIPAPRDSDMQRAELGTLRLEERECARDALSLGLRRGDVVFFPGHVGVMADPRNLIHANAFAMMVAVEPLDAVVARGNRILAVRDPLQNTGGTEK